MKFCPFISTLEQKLPPSDMNCKNCCFYLIDLTSKTKGCAISIAANNTSKALEILVKKQ